MSTNKQTANQREGGSALCGACLASVVNGLLCHEHGCPDSWKDGVKECSWCGGEFKPGYQGDEFCSGSCKDGTWDPED